jgi:hypothetical protein
MGTRGAYGLRIDGHDKLAYQHSSAYPSYLGTRIAREANALLERHGIERLRTMARALRPIPEDDPLPNELRTAFRDACTRLGSDAHIHGGDAYEALRELQGTLATFLEAGALPDYAHFPYDGLFCEWAYVLDLDTLTLEIYEGGHRTPGPGRYGQHRTDYPIGTRYGAHLVHAIPLDAIDPDAIARLDDAEPTIDAARAA